jgi:cleavage stimulation factor subunit 3
MEFYCGKDTVIPGKVFELGLKTYNEEPVYIVEYMKHLMRMNDDTSNIKTINLTTFTYMI